MNHYYQEIDGWWGEHEFYSDMVARCPNGGTMVEVGCWKGRSLSCLLVEAANSGKRLRIVGVDHWKGSVGETNLTEQAAACDLRAICEENCRRAGYPFELITADSAKPPVGPVDFVFLDASHDYESVRKDILAWLPRVKLGGIIAGHDAFVPGVEQASLELLPAREVIRGCWLHKKVT